jgi:putative addiction module antidote
MVKLTVRKIGNSLGVILPQDALNMLNLKEGDQLVMTDAPDGAKLTASDPEFERQMAIGEDLIRRYRNTLKELAK